MRIALRILAVAGGMAALVLIAIAVAIATIDVNAFAGPIRQRVRDATGRDFTVRTIGLTRSLAPKLILDDVALGNAPWGKAPQLLKARRVEAQVALLPLLQRRVDILRVEVIEPVIALETAGEGRANWVFERGPGATGSAATPAGAAPALGALTIGDLNVTRGALTFRNDVSGRTTTVAIDTLAMAARGGDAPIGVDFRGRVDDVPCALKGEFGSLDALRERRWPYPAAVRGEIGGRKAALAAKVTVTDGAFRFDDLDLTFGPNAVKGTLTATTSGPRPSVGFTLAVKALALADLPAPPQEPAAAKGAAGTGSPARTYVFGNDPVSLAPLRSVDLDGDVAIDQLTLRSGRRLDRVRARIVLRDGHADIAGLEAAAFGGSARAHLAIDAARGGQPRIALRLDAKGLDLAALLAAAGIPRDVNGGKTDVTLDVAMHGDSPRQWASTVSGLATVVVGPATIVSSGHDAMSAFDQLADAVNPFRGIDRATDLKCAVVRLPLANGIVRVDRGIAMETSKIGVSASGTLDFRDEMLDLSIRPRARTGIPVDLVQFADLVRWHGPFTSPTVAIDAKGSAATVARLGAAYASGGLSLLGEALVSRGEGGGECEAALGRTPAPAAAKASKPAQERGKSPIDDVVKSLERFLHR